jgi:hemerythrin
MAFSYRTWNEEYSVGLPLIDNQHKELLSFMNYIADYYSRGAAGNDEEHEDRFAEIIKLGLTHLQHHFSTEETLMQELHYDDYPLHKEAHDTALREFQVQTAAIAPDLVDEKQRAAGMLDIAEMLSSWIIDHMTTFDRSAALVFRARSQTAV